MRRIYIIVVALMLASALAAYEITKHHGETACGTSPNYCATPTPGGTR